MMRTAAARLLALLTGLLLLAAALPGRAETPVSLFLSFRGNVNFTGTEEVLRTKNNNDPCSLVKTGTVIYASISNIPKGATILSAQLYWAGSGNTPDYTVKFDDKDVTAPVKTKDTPTRQYTSRAYANNTYYNYFSGAADVTSIVRPKGNGTYSFSGLKVENGNPWCAAQGVVGGFALVVIYSHPDEPFRMLNLYEGFQDFQNSALKIDLGDFKVPDPLDDNVTGRVGHITWEGDQTLSQSGEDLLFNGYEMVDKYPNSKTWFNPSGNQFNSASNITGDATSYGIDFDVYTLRSPVIQPGQRSATTTYRSGQDLVILSAEIVAMPYVANADLSLEMKRNGDLTVGTQTSYTLTVTNGGIDDEKGPVTVVDTLPAGLKLDSASGTGWVCTNVKSSTKTVVTCTQDGPVKSKTTMSPIVIKVTPSATGNYTNSATVSGKTGDDNSANNIATNAGTVVNPVAAANYVLTSEACAANAVIVSSDEDEGCHTFSGPVTAADTSSIIYITNVSTVNGQQVATVKSATADTALTAQFKFTCETSTTKAIAYGKVNFACNDTNWVTVNAKIQAGKTSAVVNDASNSPLSFSYADVGRMTVTMQTGTTVSPAISFVSRPYYLGFTAIERDVDGFADREGTAATSWSKPDIGFVRSGEQFVMKLCARMADLNNSCAPSFGLEKERDSFKFTLDLFAVNLNGTPKVPIMTGSKNEDVAKWVSDAWQLDQDFALSGSVYIAKARWFEAGLLGIVPSFTYLDAIAVSGAKPGQSGRMVAGTRVVGRFYPDHFVTSATAKLDCVPSMNCPTAPEVEVEGAVYSMQPFEFGIQAVGLPKSDGDLPVLKLFQPPSIDPANARALKLTASKAPNLAPAPDVGAFAAPTAAQLKPPAVANDYPEQRGLLTWRLGEQYDASKRTASNWGAPTPVYLRAAMTELRGTGTGTASTTETITSMTPAAATAGTRYEDGLLVVSGRLSVANVFGSDLLRLPVPLMAQYWSGSAWLLSSSDDNTVASSIKPVGCIRAFAENQVSGACKANPLPIAGTVPIPLKKSGKGILVLQAPGRGTRGSVDFTVDSADAPWLPSTQARATFGLYKSPLIYLREVY